MKSQVPNLIRTKIDKFIKQKMTTWQPGKSLQNGQYRISKTLAEGGIDITYTAKEKNEKSVVIKTLNELTQCEPEFNKYQQDFRDEAERLSQFQHPNIARHIKLFQESGLWCVVMEYVEGEDLASLLKRQGRLPETEALSYIEQIGSALTACHQRGILHRDVKPQNIIKRANKSEVVLIDFGIAREFVVDVPQSNTQCRTNGFAPPEQHDIREQPGNCSDVYALAATLYMLLTNHEPTPATQRRVSSNPPGMFEKDSLKPPKDINPNISETVNRAVLKGMALDPKKRPQTVKDWLALLQPNSSASSRFTLNFSSVKTATPRVSLKRIAAIVVLLVAVVGLYTHWPNPSLGRDSTGDRNSQEVQGSTSTSSETSENSQEESPPEELDTSTESSQEESPPEELDTSTESSQDESPPEELDTPTVPSETSENSQNESPSEETPPLSKLPVYSADYTRLENLLASKNFQEADEETLWIMLEIANRQRKGWLDVENIQNFPCADLDKLDALWYDYSEKRFGFTMQKNQWLNSGGQAGVYDVKVADKFGDRVGWRVNNKWYKQINYQLSAPIGHFPVKANSYAWELNAPYFAERLDACNIP